jgi:hypothetical protein
MIPRPERDPETGIGPSSGNGHGLTGNHSIGFTLIAAGVFFVFRGPI